ncbi:hypothetical protein I6F53_10060 [Pseudoalteromonas sp. SWN29]|uniref:hypothetical protein n=1 Tax=Pseudoalteromonas sp. SWN29 TaxID=2792064 RepID=UPI0018CD583F|nr:hypothetical protein [Pseudoalteromonas sp. SWN29]MBH0027333.1 hypothetical protein [Pseudoalteromonas sp. SWN29]
MIELSKSETALLAVVLGWFLGQGAELFKSYIARKKMLKAFYSELDDILDHLNQSKEKCESGLKNARYKTVMCPQKIIRPVYDSYYKDIYTSLTPSKRKAINKIHGHVTSFNQRLVAIDESFNNLELKFLAAYIDALWAAELIKHLKDFNGTKELKDDEDKITLINTEIQNLTKQNHI